MSLIGWNCRGLGSSSAIPDLKHLVLPFNPDLLFLSEILVHRNKIEDLRYLLGFDACIYVDRTGRGGGLALFWRISLICQLVDFSIIISPLRLLVMFFVLEYLPAIMAILMELVDFSIIISPLRLLVMFFVLEYLPAIMAILMEVVELPRGIFFVNFLINLQDHGVFWRF
ncbi:endonuclease/exonuclease/phosphatase family protein [Medicago truncatula]|uniref:Endonuclease/exonuclease/phosphatase family protein n=1 Tax=Medicago truncatula TaxID=3880 RepID=A0A072UBQ2_MEDTR|nr:endonuclease/exonuclease/phosphatase family protein [Medicago truncatula]